MGALRRVCRVHVSDIDPHEEARLTPLAPPQPPRPSSSQRRFALDLRPLRRSRDLRLLVLGQGAGYLGGSVTMVALPLQAYRLTHSTVIVGLLSLSEFVPLLLASPLAGALADAVDRRRLVLLTEAIRAVMPLLLLADALLAHPRLWIIFATAACATTFTVL
jgi:MFS family permease